MKQTRCWIIAGFVAVLTAPLMSRAQSETASLTITISDRSGQRVPSAIATVQRTSTGAMREIKSSAEGVAWVSSLAPDVYEVTVKADGFKLFHDPAVRLQVAEPASLSVTLQVGQLLETVDVTKIGRAHV